MKTERSSPERSEKKPIDRQLSLGTSQDIGQTGDGSDRPLDANNKEADPDMLLAPDGEPALKGHRRKK